MRWEMTHDDGLKQVAREREIKKYVIVFLPAVGLACVFLLSFRLSVLCVFGTTLNSGREFTSTVRPNYGGLLLQYTFLSIILLPSN